MNLMIRTMRDKFGARRHVIFKESEGLQNPITIMSEEDWDQLVEMHDAEQKVIDDLLAGKK